MSTLGEQVQRARLALERTQAEVAAEVGVTNAYLSKIESGKELPSEDVIARLAEVLRLDLVALLFASGRVPAFAMDHLDAVTTERDVLLSIVRDLAARHPGFDTHTSCLWCADAVEDHTDPDCLWVRARAFLASQETPEGEPK